MNSISISKNLNREVVSVNSLNSGVIVSDILKRCDDIKNSFDDMSKLFNKLVYKKMVKGEETIKLINLSRKCKLYSKNISRISKEFSRDYNGTVRSYELNNINDRINNLESRLESIVGEVMA